MKKTLIISRKRLGRPEDKFGVSWQIVSEKMSKMIAVGTCEQIDCVTQTLLPMKRYMISDLEKTDKELDMAQVISKDGTKIVYDKVGQGPVVVLVEGATATRSSFIELANLLAPQFYRLLL